MKFKVGEEVVVAGNTEDVLPHMFNSGERVVIIEASEDLVREHTIYICRSKRTHIEQILIEEDLATVEVANDE